MRPLEDGAVGPNDLKEHNNAICGQDYLVCDFALGKGRTAICRDDDGSSQVVADLCNIVSQVTAASSFCGRSSSSAQDQYLEYS